MNENGTNKNCTNCKVECLLKHFKVRKNGEYNKMCNMCLDARKKLYYANREKSIERQKKYYNDNKDKIFEYRKKNQENFRETKRKYYYDNWDELKKKRTIYRLENRDLLLEKSRKYNKENRCPHERVPYTCKDCLDEEDLIKYTFKTMILSSRRADKKSDRLDENHFIDLNFLYTKLNDYPKLKCYHCTKTMSFNPEDKNNLITIERLNNKIGHTKANCEFCCFHCNIKKMSDKNTNKKKKNLYNK